MRVHAVKCIVILFSLMLVCSYMYLHVDVHVGQSSVVAAGTYGWESGSVEYMP